MTPDDKLRALAREIYAQTQDILMDTRDSGLAIKAIAAALKTYGDERYREGIEASKEVVTTILADLVWQNIGGTEPWKTTIQYLEYAQRDVRALADEALKCP